MTGAAIRQRPVQGPPQVPFVVGEHKLRPPTLAVPQVPRAGLNERWRDLSGVDLLLVVAPGGYGKTSTLRQLAAEAGERGAWLSLDDLDDDPTSLLTSLAAALGGVVQVDDDVLTSIASPAPALGRAGRALAASIARAPEPFVLFLDDLHVITDPLCLDTLTRVVGAVPDASRIVAATRRAPEIGLARLRTSGRLAEWDWRDLVMDREESRQLLTLEGVQPSDQELDSFVDATEGWPAGLFLTALSHRAGGKPLSEPIHGDERHLASYFRAEILANLPPKDVRFLTRSSILERVEGSLCDEVCRTRRSAATLERLSSENAMVVPLDDRNEWFRYHRLFRDLLRAELLAREPEIAPELHRRAVAAFVDRGMVEEAVEHAFAAGDLDTAGALVAGHGLRVHASGRTATTRRWVERFPIDRAARWPGIAILSAWSHALAGEAAEADRWADVLWPSDGRPGPELGEELRAAALTLRAVCCRGGVDGMLEDARLACDALPTYSPWQPAGLTALGIALDLSGRQEESDGTLAEATAAAAELGAFPAATLAWSWRASLALDRGDPRSAETSLGHAVQALTQGRLEGYVTSALAFALAARCAMHRGDPDRARRELAGAHRLRPVLTRAIPWLTVKVGVESAAASLALSDPAGARVQLLEIEEVLHQRPRLGTLAGAATDLRERLDAFPAGAASASTLTTAEVRLLPFLPTHLTFAEIGERLFVSRSTVKTQALSIYRKLGVSSRSDAVERARELSILQD